MHVQRTIISSRARQSEGERVRRPRSETERTCAYHIVMFVRVIRLTRLVAGVAGRHVGGGDGDGHALRVVQHERPDAVDDRVPAEGGRGISGSSEVREGGLPGCGRALASA